MNDDILDSEDINNGERPQFLTVLCILTFIWSGLSVLGGVMGLVGISALSSFATVGGSIIWSLLGLIAAGLCLFGAVQMWGLKKQGLMLYFVGSVLAIIITILNTISLQSQLADIGGDEAFNSVASTVGYSAVVIGVIITIAFMVMYNMNKKALVN